MIIPDIESWCRITFTPYHANGSYYYDYTSNPLDIAHDLYMNGEKVVDLIVPNTVTSIGAFAFWQSSIASVTIPNSVTTISTAAFYGCEGLKTLALGNSLNRILEDAFKRCSNLTNVTFPKSLTYIGNEAFGKCTNLKVVT